MDIDQEKETAQLTADINSHKDVTREPVFSESGYGKYSRDVGDTYIDVDISNQVVKMYKNGALVFSASCVTGNRATGTTTDTGTYYVLNKIRDVVLRGENVDGSEYASPVKYWLGVTWGGQGLHDADWRDTFGGGIWKTDGSHGCINMPPAQMPALFNAAEVGMPGLCITDDDAGFSSLNQNPARFSGSVAAFHQKSHFSARLTRAIAEFLALQDGSATACRIFSHSNIPGVLIFHINPFVVHIGSFIVFYADFVAVFFTLQQNPANSCVSAAGFRSFF